MFSILDVDFDKPFWKRGDYPTYYVNGTETLPLTNPWYQSENKNAPFDQCECYLPPSPLLSLTCLAFYLILNVAVGGTNGFFQDNLGGKPWLDSSLNAMGGESLVSMSP